MEHAILLDELSLLATCNTKTSFKNFEKVLQKQGYTLGYKPLIQNRKGKACLALTLKTVLDEKIPNQWGFRYGEIDDLCMALRVKRKSSVIQTRRTPKAATGPDIKKIFIGSRGVYGDIQEATFRIHPIPNKKLILTISWKSKGRDPFLHKLGSSGVRQASCVLKGKTKLTLQLEGLYEIVRAELKTVKKLAAQTGGKIDA
jgi:hypothetical protein